MIDTLFTENFRKKRISHEAFSIIEINVFDTSMDLVSGVYIFIDGSLKGVTGSDFKSPGYFKLCLNSGTHSLRVEKDGRFNEITITAKPFASRTIDIMLEHGVYKENHVYNFAALDIIEGLSFSENIMTESRGGNHIFIGCTATDNYVIFDEPQLVVSFEMNLRPVPGDPCATAPYEIEVNAMDIHGNILRSEVVNLSATLDWSNWITVHVSTPNIKYLQFKKTGHILYPSINNIRVVR